MARNKDDFVNVIGREVSDFSLDEIMENSFGRYSKEIIQERALPDVRDGLKPVQRRILFGMQKAGYTFDKPYQKSAKAVGYIMGNFHPHGDSSIYDAIIHLSQPWKMREPFIDVHGNNGSIDGDGPAASRYTEARLAKISEMMLGDIKKDTVEMTYNFDDTELEPTVLPARFPNLLVNGSTGISAGYATEIPSHNLSEVIDATIKRIESPNSRLETIMDIMPGPDFATGGVIEGREELIKAYTTGRGKVVLRADCEIVEEKGHKQIIVKSIPYGIVKEQLLKKIIDIKLDKKIEGINDVVDESDYENMARLVIDLKKGVDASLILKYLYKNTDLQVNYNFNMVAIVNRRPKYVGVLDILDAFIAHQKQVVTRRTAYDKRKAEERLNVLEGVSRAISILDEVIKVIRASKNKQDSIENLIKEFDFNFEQAKYIVEMQLYRLTNTDILDVTKEMEELRKNIAIWTQILNNEDALKHVMITELKLCKKEYGNARRTIIKDEITKIDIDEKAMIPKEQVVVVVTKEGYLKRVSKKSYDARNDEMPSMKPGDYIINTFDVSTLDNIILFTNRGNYAFLPVIKIPDSKWKEIGKHLNNIVSGVLENEKVVSAFIYEKEGEFTLATKNGMVKRTLESEFEVSRTSKIMTAMKLKDNDDEVVAAFRTKKNILMVTSQGYYVMYPREEVTLVGVRGSGVKGIALKDDTLASAIGFNDTEYISVFTDKDSAKRLKLSELVYTGRGRKGNTLIKKVKTSPYKITKVMPTNTHDDFMIVSDDGLLELKNTNIPIMDINSVGSVFTKNEVFDVIPVVTLESKKEANVNNSLNVETIETANEVKEEVKEQVSFNLDDFKL